jgi:hypothetical protein
MTSQQLIEARQRIGWTDHQLAEWLNVPVERLRGWEAGPHRVPPLVEEKVRWAEYEADVRRAGIPACEWADAWDATPFPEDDEEMLESLRELEAHEKACPICTALNQYAEQHPPPNRRP